MYIAPRLHHEWIFSEWVSENFVNFAPENIWMKVYHALDVAREIITIIIIKARKACILHSLIIQFFNVSLNHVLIYWFVFKRDPYGWNSSNWRYIRNTKFNETKNAFCKIQIPCNLSQHVEELVAQIENVIEILDF